MKHNKAMREYLAKLSAAAEARKIHADAIAVKNGYRDGSAAFRGMGKEFIALVQKTAPSITAAMRTVPLPMPNASKGS